MAISTRRAAHPRARLCALLLVSLPAAQPARSIAEKCHVRPGGASVGNSFAVARDGPAGNSSARPRCYERVMAMPATMCKVEPTVRELCAHSYVFVGGLFHSGTGALRKALAAVAPLRVSVHAGMHAIEDEGKYVQTVYLVNRNRDAKLWHCAFIESQRDAAQHPPHTPGSLWRDESDALASAPKGSTLLFAQWARYWDLSAPILVEKSPMNMLRTRFLDTLFPEMASFAVVIRHPFGACTMQLKILFKTLLAAPLPAEPSGGARAEPPPVNRRGRPQYNLAFIFRRLDSILSAWLDLYARYEDDSRHVARATMLRFETMVAAPHEAARRALGALGMAPDATRGRTLNFDKWASAIDPRHAFEWHWQYGRRFEQLQWLARAERGATERTAWDELVRTYEPRLRRYGYSLVNFTSVEPALVPIVCF
jgi:hypothetical protein